MKTSNGFTLIEMIVVISIFTVMTGVVLANLPQFRDQTALQLVAQKMSITIREAQVYGVGVKYFTIGSDFPSHGINFDDLSVPSNKKSYVLFADSNKNNIYNSPNELVIGYDLTGAVEIFTIKACNPNCDVDLSNLGLNIVFERPNTEANFRSLSGSVIIASYVEITLRSTRSGKTRAVQVWNTGQISVKNQAP
ncbi:MAG: type II secretion system protein [Patescibacteria group bacterium]